MNEKRLNEIKARAEAATPGEWQYIACESADWLLGNMRPIETLEELSTQVDLLNPYSDHEFSEEDLAFIAHARQDVPDLVAEVERLRAALEEIRDLARTGSIPDAMGCTEDQWNWHKVNRIAGMASDALKGND
jgi:hypothetical protein